MNSRRSTNMVTYNLQLVIVQEPWRHNASGVAYCYEQEPLSIYDPELFQWIALVDILNPELWGLASRICYGVPAGEPLRLPRLGDDETPRVVMRYDATTRRYLVYPEDAPAAARAKVALRDALTLALDMAAGVG